MYQSMDFRRKEAEYMGMYVDSKTAYALYKKRNAEALFC